MLVLESLEFALLVVGYVKPLTAGGKRYPGDELLLEAAAVLELVCGKSAQAGA